MIERIALKFRLEILDIAVLPAPLTARFQTIL
jgi:hypothetical protein